MKIKKIPQRRNKLVKLKLIQTKIYTKEQYLENIKIEDIEYRLKKICYLIYKYNVFNKRILFVGLPFNITLKLQELIKNTKHIFIPNSVWLSGAISNKNTNFSNLLKNKNTTKNQISELLFQLKKNIDLVIIINNSDNTSDILNEGYVARIPVVMLNTNLNICFNKPSYKVPGNFKFVSKKTRNNLFYSLLISTLRKGSTKVIKTHYKAVMKKPNKKSIKENYKKLPKKSYKKIIKKV
uniref:Ribosomal protein S2 n=1 Tax=Fistulifera saprophila TaxID=880757 RepID=A0A8F1B7F4_9STRA|nr:ribosomal protein S2 [Fistulifera saprophila]QWM93298.1 ribosomal protein S2 [Fistulifera saprophila]